MSRKRLQRIALEQDEDGRAAFVARMAQHQPEELGFLDKTSKDEQTLRRNWSWSRTGDRAVKKQVYVRGRGIGWCKASEVARPGINIQKPMGAGHTAEE